MTSKYVYKKKTFHSMICENVMVVTFNHRMGLLVSYLTAICVLCQNVQLQPHIKHILLHVWDGISNCSFQKRKFPICGVHDQPFFCQILSPELYTSATLLELTSTSWLLLQIMLLCLAFHFRYITMPWQDCRCAILLPISNFFNTAL